MSDFQTGFATKAANGSFTVTGPTTSLTCTPYGPAATLRVNGPQNFGNSWVFANLGVQWYTVNVSYTATPANPLATVCIDSSSGLTAQFANTGGAIAIAFSDSTAFNFTQTAGLWRLQ